MNEQNELLRDVGCVWSLHIEAEDAQKRAFLYEIGWIVNAIGQLQEAVILYKSKNEENVEAIRSYFMQMYRECYIAIIEENRILWVNAADGKTVNSPYIQSAFPVVQSNNGIHFIYSTLVKALQNLKMDGEEIMAFLRGCHLMHCYLGDELEVWLELDHEEMYEKVWANTRRTLRISDARKDIGWSHERMNAVKHHFAALPVSGANIANSYLYWEYKLSNHALSSTHEFVLMQTAVKYLAIEGRVCTLSPVMKEWIVSLAVKKKMTACIHVEQDEQNWESLHFIMNFFNDPRQQVVKTLKQELSDFDWLILNTSDTELNSSLYEQLLKTGGYILQCVSHPNYYGYIQYQYLSNQTLVVMKKSIFERKKEEGK